MAAPDELSALLAAENFGTVGTNLFRHQLPATPDAAIAVKQRGGAKSILASGSGTPGKPREVAEIVDVRFEIRDVARDAAESTCYAVRDVVQGLANQTLSGVRYLAVFVTRPPGPLKVDATAQRFTWYFEARVTKEPS